MTWRNIDGNEQALAALRHSLQTREAIAFVGAGASVPLYPLWGVLIHKLIDSARERGLAQEATCELWRRTAEKNPQDVAQQLKNALGNDYLLLLREQFKPPAGGRRAYTTTHRQLLQLPFGAYATTNYDTGLLEARAASGTGGAATGYGTWKDADFISAWMTGSVFASVPKPILFAHGIFDRSDTIVLARDEYRAAYTGTPYRRLFEHLWTSRQLIFVGFGFSDHWFDFLATETVAPVTKHVAAERQHIAILALARDHRYAPEMRMQWRDKYNASAIFYRIGMANGLEDHGELLDILQAASDICTEEEPRNGHEGSPSSRVSLHLPAQPRVDSKKEPLKLAEAALEKVRTSLERLNTQHSADSAFFEFFAGWLVQLADQLPTDRRFRASTQYYPKCLQLLHSWGATVSAKAVADLSDNIEQWWLTAGHRDTQVKERIFLIDPLDLMSDERSGRRDALLTLLREEARKGYQVLVSRAPPKSTQHPFGRESAAWDVVIFPSTFANEGGVVGGYVNTSAPSGVDAEVALQITADGRTFAAAQRYYDFVYQSSFPFRADSGLAGLREDWKKKYEVGIWNSSWGENVDERTQAYIDYYDEHIRCWVPHYDQLLKICRIATIHEFVARLMKRTERISILEIGFGTAALTVPLMSWIQEYVQVSSAWDDVQVIYEGVDKSAKMHAKGLDICRQRFEKSGSSGRDMVHVGRNVDLHLRRGEFPGSLPPELVNRRFDIICGSLVLHDIWGEHPEERLRSVLASTTQKLKNDGVLVIAEILFDDDASRAAKQHAYWERHMREYGGLSRDEIANFLDENKEMSSRTARIDLLRKVANELSFIVEEPDRPITTENPFSLVRLRRAVSEDHEGGQARAAPG